MSDPSSSTSADRIGAKLNESNFLEWKDNMMGLLMAKKLWNYITTDHDATDINDQQAKGYIWINIEHQQRSHVPAGASAHQTWTALCAKHEQVGPQVIANCIFGITALRYVDGTKMEDHLAKLKEYFTRLDAVNCQLPETVKAVLIIASLSSSWTVFKQTQTAAASNANPLTVSTICLAILQERDRRLTEERTAQPSIDSPNALAASQLVPQPSKNTKRQDRNQLICTWCGKPRHEEKECWSKRDGRPRTYQGNQANVVSPGLSTGNSRVISNTDYDHMVFTAASTDPDAGTWYIDSGASNHYCHEAKLLNAVVPCTRPDIISANGERVPVLGSGTVDLTIRSVSEGRPDIRITLTDVSLAPGLATNLVSVARLAAAGLKVHFSKKQCIISRHKRVIAIADLVESSNLYRLRTSQIHTSAHASAKALPQYCLAVGEQAKLPMHALWHQRLGHIHHMAVSTLLGRNMTADVHHAISGGDTTHCDACVLGKHHRSPVLGKVKAGRATRPLFRLHLDICGPFSMEAHNGSLYLLQIVDDYSRYVWARTMPNRETQTVLTHLKNFVSMAEAMHSGDRVSVLRTDNGPELVAAAFNEWLHSRGIRRERTAVYTPNQNGVVERMNRAVVELARTMLIAACLPIKFWALAMDVAVYCRNRSPTTSLDDRTPYEACCGKRPSISHMRIFGCLAFAHIRKDERKKLDPKAKACIFVGYSPDSTTYRLWDLQSDKLIESRDVYFVESQLGIKARGADGEAASAASILPRLDSSDSDASNASNADESELPPLIPPPRNPLPSHAGTGEVHLIPSDSQGITHLQATDQPQVNTAAVASPRTLSREERSLQDSLRSGPKYHAPSTIANLALIAHASVSHSTNGSVDSDPTTYGAAISSPQQELWRAAMDSEMASLHKAGTFTLVPLPANRTAIGCKWVYKTKRGADGAITKHKARLVAKGFLQRYGVDYDETYAPVARYPSIRAILALTAHHDWELHQMDIKSAYLNGDLEEDIFMAQPEGYVAAGQQHLVCKLNKSLYGLKQAGRTWHIKIDIALKREDFTPLDADQCVYIRRQETCITIIALYVDDLLIACSHPLNLMQLKKQLTTQFDMEDLGEATFILGVDIRRDRPRRAISIGQSAYVTSLLERHGMSECKAVSTPMERASKTAMTALPTDHKATDSEIRDYQAIIGGLMFAMVCTRPDIAFAVTTLAQFASNPTPVHIQGVKRILRYLRGTVDRCITYKGTGSTDSQPELIGYCDADWGGGQGCRSVTGYAFTMAGGAISWQSKKQKTVALSTVEAEYMATTQATKEAIWWRSFLAGVGHDMSSSTIIYSDSQGCWSMQTQRYAVLPDDTHVGVYSPSFAVGVLELAN